MDIETLIDIFEEVEETSSDSFFSFFAVPPEPPKRMALFLTERKPNYETKNLVLVLLGMIMEVFELKTNADYAAVLLKNTNAKGVYLLDGTRKIFPDFHFKCIAVSERSTSISFIDPLDMGRIEDTIISAGKRFGEEFVSSEEISRKRKKIDFFIGGKKIFCLSPYAITLFLSSDMKAKKSIVAFSELATRIHQDDLFNKENAILPLRKYVFFLKLAGPTLFTKSVAENIRMIGEAVIKEGLSNDALVETRSSELRRNKEARRFKVPDKYLGGHISYVVFLEETKEFVIRFKIPIDVPYVKVLLEEKGMSLGNESKSNLSKVMSIKKGRGVRIAHRNFRIFSTPVFFQGTEVAKVEGRHTLVFSLANLDRGTTIFSTIYENAALTSGWVATADVECDLSEFERAVIKNVNDLLSFYNFFIRSFEDKESFEMVISRGGEVDARTSWERVMDIFRSHFTEGRDFYSVFYATLEEVSGKAAAYVPLLMRMERETREEARAKLEKMNRMMEVCKLLAQKVPA